MAPRRQIYACLAVLAAGLLVLGCGGSDDSGEPFSGQEVADYTDNLDKIGGYVADGDCDAAEGKLAALVTAVEDSNQDQDQTKSDLLELLDRLGGQISEDCEPPEETSSTSSTTAPPPEESAPTETTSEPTETTDEEFTTTTDKPADEPTDETTPPDEPPTEPPGGGGGGGGSGGVSPGFEAGKKPDKGSKPGKGPKPDKPSKEKR